MTDQEIVYGEYEAALDALSDVPEALRRAVSAAANDRANARRAADKAATGEVARLNALLRSAQGQYQAAAEKLNANGIPAPAKVRPTETTGGEASLRSMIAAQNAAVAGVDAALRAAASQAQRATNQDLHRSIAAQQAQNALRSRQEKIQRNRAAVTQQAHDAEAAASIARHRKLVMLCGVGVLLLVVVIIIVIASTY